MHQLRLPNRRAQLPRRLLWRDVRRRDGCFADVWDDGAAGGDGAGGDEDHLDAVVVVSGDQRDNVRDAVEVKGAVSAGEDVAANLDGDAPELLVGGGSGDSNGDGGLNGAGGVGKIRRHCFLKMDLGGAKAKRADGKMI